MIMDYRESIGNGRKDKQGKYIFKLIGDYLKNSCCQYKKELGMLGGGLCLVW
jgi:hypothetical protein